MAGRPQDHDHDGKLSFADYERAVREETLLLEAFGPCLPDPKVTALRAQGRDQHVMQELQPRTSWSGKWSDDSRSPTENSC